MYDNALTVQLKYFDLSVGNTCLVVTLIHTYVCMYLRTYVSYTHKHVHNYVRIQQKTIQFYMCTYVVTLGKIKELLVHLQTHIIFMNKEAHTYIRKYVHTEPK